MNTKLITEVTKELLLIPISDIKRSAHQENIIKLNVYVPNSRALKCTKQKLIKL